MAFALTSFEAFPLQIDEPIQKRAVQVVRFTITALAADVDLDFGDVAGTFWTAAIANGTYGTSATAKTYWTQILANAASIISLYSFEIQKNKVPVGSGTVATGQVKFNVTAAAPEILFFAGEGITSLTLTLQINLQNSKLPVTYSY